MRALAILLCLCLLLTPGMGGSTERTAPINLQLQVSDDGNHFSYSIASPERVREAWIEVVDQPALLDRKPVPVQASGAVDWEWDRTGLNYYEEEEDNLSISLWDPDGETLYCEGTTMYAKPGGEVSPATVGSRGKFEPAGRLAPYEVRAAVNSPSVTIPVTGLDLTPQTVFHFHSEKNAACKSTFIRTDTLDLAHARIIVAGECLRTPGIFYLAPDDDQQAAAWVHVASPASPVLRSVSPARVPAGLPQDQLTLVLRGSGFTQDSRIFAGYLPTANTLYTPQLPLETEYISPRELRAHVDAGYGNDPLGRLGDRLRIWVVGNEEKFELSEPFDVAIMRPAGDTNRSGVAVITSVSPYPIPLMTAHSPAELKITIHGTNFVPENKVIADFGRFAPNHRELRMEYVSPTTLRAWIPRQFWRKHQLSYQLVVETTSGERLTRRIKAPPEDP
jgi:hypothetical protein